MQAEVEQVLTVCPHVDVDDVIRDLNCTGNAEETINRIFDGTFLSALDEEDQSPTREILNYSLTTSPHRDHKPDNAVHADDLDSDDELPDMCLSKIRTNRTGPRPVASNSKRAPGKASSVEDRLASKDDSDDGETSKPLTGVGSHSGGKLGHVDRWLQQSQLTRAQKYKDTLDNFGSSSGKDRDYVDDIIACGNQRSLNSCKDSVEESCSTTTFGNNHRVHHNNKIQDKCKRRISISSSDEEEAKSLTDQNLVTSGKFSFQLKKGLESPKDTMKRSCSPISVSDSDDDEDLLTLTLKHRVNSHPYPVDNGSSQSTMCSMDYDTETGDSSTQQTGDTYSSVGSSSAWSMVTDSQDPGKKKKRKRTPEEIEESKRQALEKKQQRELAKEAKKREKEKEKEGRKALQAARKADRPEECMKYVRVVLDPTLLEEVGGGAILTKLESLDSKYAIEPQPVSSIVTWRRLGTGINLGEDIQLQSINTEKDECEALVLLPTSNFVDMVYVFKQEQQGTCYAGMESLRSYTQSLQRILAGKQVTFVVMSMEKYFRHQKNSHNRQFRSAVLGAQGNEGKTKRRKKGVEEITTCVSRVDVEEALVDLQLHTDCNVKFAEKPAEVAELIAMFTKSVAETPFKQERDKATFSFHVDNEWAGGIRVSKDGIGLLKLWRQQLQQFRNVSPEVASAIIAVYPSPRLLLQAYSRCTTTSQAQKLLQDIMIRRGEGVLATSRRVGGVLSKRVHTLLTSHNGELVL